MICLKNFITNVSPSEIKMGKGKVCSPICKSKLNSSQKTKGFHKKCELCNKDFWCRPSENLPGKKHYKRFCSMYCYKNRKGTRPKINGKYISNDGYFIVYINGKAVKEHRLIMEQHLGRKLTSSEIIHHIDHNKLNNSLNNLQMTTIKEHSRHHLSINDGLTNQQRFKLRHPERNKEYKLRAKRRQAVA